MPFNVLVLGDVVGRPGRTAVTKLLPGLRERLNVDFTVLNGENAAAGSGLTPDIVGQLLKHGVDVITTGDHVFRRREIMGVIEKEPRLLRPSNLSDLALGVGRGRYQVGDVVIGVVNLLGRIFLKPADCPFAAVDRELDYLRNEGARVLLVDFHAEATSEKVAMGWYLDGRVSAVIGTHTHVPTADERVLPKGTAYITDVGMCGPHESVIGREIEPVLENFRTQMPQRFDVARKDVRINGALISLDPGTGRAQSIQRIAEPYHS